MKISVKPECLKASLSLGCFTGWYFSVLKLAQISLSETYALTLFDRLKTAFYTSELVSLIVIIAILTVFDIENIITHKIMRYIPGLILAEGIIAVSLCTAKTAVLFAVIAGIGSSVGAVAVLTSLLKVRTRDRLKVVGCALALGAVIYLLACVALPAAVSGIWGKVIAGLLVAVLCGFFVGFEPFSANTTGIINHFNEKTVKYIFKKLPFEYIIFIPLCTLYLVCFYISGDFAKQALPYDFRLGELISYLVFALVAVLAGFAVKPHSAAPMFAAAAAVSGAGVLMLSINALTDFEVGMYQFFAYAGYALFKGSIYLLVTAFALGRLHPLFYAVVGYLSYVVSELAASAIASGINASSAEMAWVFLVFLGLAPVAWLFISKGLARGGYTEQAIERRRCIRREITALAKKCSLSGRECIIIELLSVEKCPPEELIYNMFVSQNSLKRHIENIEKRTGVSLDELVSNLLEKYDNTEAV